MLLESGSPHFKLGGAQAAQFPSAKEGDGLQGVEGGVESGMGIWEGRSMSVVSRQWLDRGNGYGPVLSVPAAQPGGCQACYFVSAVQMGG